MPSRRRTLSARILGGDGSDGEAEVVSTREPDRPPPFAAGSDTLVPLFFEPNESELGARLRTRAAPVTRSFQSLEVEQAFNLHRRCVHAAGCLPSTMAARVLDGARPGSASQVSTTGQVAHVAQALSAHAGADGASLQPKLATLAKLADFIAAGGFSTSPITTVNMETDFLGPVVIAEYLTWERARGFKTGSVYTATSALSDLKFAVRHMGLLASIDDLTNNGIVLAAAQPSVEPGTDAPVPSHAGVIPLRIQAGREAAALTGPGEELSLPQWHYSCVTIIMWLFGLRGKEARSARLELEPDDRYIKISFQPKGRVKGNGGRPRPRITAWRLAFGVLGPFRWWPRFRESMSGKPSLFVRINTGSILTATDVADGMPPKANTISTDLFSLPVFGVPDGVVSSLGLKGHSDHGTVNAVIRLFGSQLGFNMETDPLIAGHWKGSGGTSSAGAGGSSSARDSAASARRAAALARSLQMPALYADDSTRKDEGSRLLFRVVFLAYLALHAEDRRWDELDPLDGWHLVLRTALAAKHSGRPFVAPLYPDFSMPTLLHRRREAAAAQTPPASPASAAADDDDEPPPLLLGGPGGAGFGTPQLALPQRWHTDYTGSLSDAPLDGEVAAFLYHLAGGADPVGLGADSSAAAPPP